MLIVCPHTNCPVFGTNQGLRESSLLNHVSTHCRLLNRTADLANKDSYNTVFFGDKEKWEGVDDLIWRKTSWVRRMVTVAFRLRALQGSETPALARLHAETNPNITWRSLILLSAILLAAGHCTSHPGGFSSSSRTEETSWRRSETFSRNSSQSNRQR